MTIAVDVSLRFDTAEPQVSEMTKFIANEGDALWVYAEEDGAPYK